jgi:hypothetical protein
MMERWTRTYWWVILVLATLAAGMVLSETSLRRVQRAAMLLIVYSVAVTYIWLRVRLALAANAAYLRGRIPVLAIVRCPSPTICHT